MSRIPRRVPLPKVLLLAAAVTVATSPLRGQHLEPIRVTATEPAQVDADSLEAHAARLAMRPGGWRDAATLERRAAQRRGDDPRAVAAWSRAAWLYAAGGRLGLARRMMQQSAEQAERGGDVERAAAAYIDAALIAEAERRSDLVTEMLRRMRRVTASPLLSAERRERILARVEGEPLLARGGRSVPDSTRVPIR